MNTEKEPVLMPYQKFPFNNDTFIQEEFIRLRDEFKTPVCVETGTCLGSTAKWMGEQFEQVHTVEINEEFARFARPKLKENTTLHIGSSPDALKQILPGIADRCIIFLDAHWGPMCPLIEELKAIKEHAKQKPVIAIHDFKVPGWPRFGFDSYNGQEFTYEWLKECFDDIYGPEGYSVHYNTGFKEDSAQRGIIYITPK